MPSGQSNPVVTGMEPEEVHLPRRRCPELPGGEVPPPGVCACLCILRTPLPPCRHTAAMPAPPAAPACPHGVLRARGGLKKLSTADRAPAATITVRAGEGPPSPLERLPHGSSASAGVVRSKPFLRPGPCGLLVVVCVSFFVVSRGICSSQSSLPPRPRAEVDCDEPGFYLCLSAEVNRAATRLYLCHWAEVERGPTLPVPSRRRWSGRVRTDLRL